MGRRNKAYYKDLHQQAYDKLVGMQAFGESKRAAVAAGTRATGSTPSILSSTSRSITRNVPH